MKALLEWLYPAHAQCMGCQAMRLPAEGPPLCGECRLKLRKAALPKPFCAWCGYPTQGKACTFCKEAKHIRYVTAPFTYRAPVGEMIRRFKYRGWGQALPFLVENMCRAWRQSNQPQPDICLAVPMTALRRRIRGGNQAEMLCRQFCLAMDLPMAQPMSRIRQGVGSQARLSGAQRRRNIKGCFQVDDPELVKGKRILLVDDVVTTGATADECARMLLKAGAVEVRVLAAAITLRA